MKASGFTLVELLVVIAIIAILAGLSTPMVGSAIERGRSTKCLNNLRQIGVAVQQYAADNDYRFPAIETVPPSLPPEVENPGTALDKLGTYGITQDVLTCPSDAATKKNFEKHGTSYYFSPVLQDETPATVKIYSRRGAFQISNIGRVTVASDLEPVHAVSGKYGINMVKADGHVVQR